MRFAAGGIVALCLGVGVANADDAAPAEPAEPTHAETPKPAVDQIAKLQAQIDELKATTEAALAASSAGEESKEPTFRIYGFIDMGLQKVWDTQDHLLPTRKTTFVLGNVNLYFDFHPAPDWSALVETRLTNYPSGTETAAIPAYGINYTRESATALDPGNGDGSDSVRWGAIVLERAYIQWQRSPKLGVRVGQFLTPYGIWNVDHGTPTLISLYRPKSQSNELFPRAQLGVEAFGAIDDAIADKWRLEYHGYVSNGRTPGVVALSEQKMFGGRVAVSTLHPVPMTFGVSSFRGHYLAQETEIDPSGVATRTDAVAYDEYAIGVDASVDLGGLRLRAEGALRHKEYDEDKREPSLVPGVFIADGNEMDVYALAAYRIPHTRFEPYLYGELYSWSTPLGRAAAAYTSVGLNTYFTPAIQLKLQYINSNWFDNDSVIQSKTGTRESFLAAKLVMGF